MKEITIADNSEIDQTSPLPQTISGVWRSLWNDPGQFIRYWNYKGAILSGVMRAPIFLVTYLLGKESIKLAIGAALAQFAFRFLFAGVGGTLIQSFRHVEPAWKALLAVLLIVPLISHVLEFGVQALFAFVTGTQDHTGSAILRSICVSIISALFTLFAMRRGVMVVGDEDSKSLMNDISRLPLIIFDFVAFIPNEIAFMIRRKEFVSAALSFAAFGVFAQLLCSAVTSKMSWTYGGGKEIELLKYWGVDGMILMLLAVLLSSFVYFSKRRNAAE